MFCKTCGKELNDDASFCNNCGTPVGQVSTSNVSLKEDKKKEDNVVRLEIKPTFVFGYQVIREFINTIVWLFLILCCIEINPIALVKYFPLFSLIVVFVILVVRLVFVKAQYNKITYRFLKTKIEYVDGFLNKEEKQLKYEHIREITMSQNVLERIFGIGRIRLFTNASSAFVTGHNHKQTGKNGIDIHCVTNVKEQYLAAKAILDEMEE